MKFLRSSGVNDQITKLFEFTRKRSTVSALNHCITPLMELSCRILTLLFAPRYRLVALARI